MWLIKSTFVKRLYIQDDNKKSRTDLFIKANGFAAILLSLKEATSKNTKTKDQA